MIAYHRYRFWRPRFWALLRRNHRKTLVCDGRIAFAGGLNISNEWVVGWRRRRRLARRRRPGRRPRGRGHRGDLPAHLEPAREEVGAPGSRARCRRRPPPATTPLVVISNSELRDRFAIRRAALHAMRESAAARLPRQPLLRARSRRAAGAAACRRARRRRPAAAAAARATRGILDLAARAVFGPLLAAGVRIWQSRAVVHTKVLAVDDAFVSIGSYNFDHRSLAYNLEMVVNVLDARASGRRDRDAGGGHRRQRRADARRRSAAGPC